LKGLTDKEFGDLIGVGESTVRHYYLGTRYPQDQKIIEIANILNVSLEWLLTGKESTFEPPLTAPEDLVGEAHKIYKAYYVPVVSTVTAGDTGAILEESNIMYMVPVAEKPTPTSIMVEVSGDSMTRDRGRTINPGDLVYIDTKETVAFDGDLVVVTTLDGRQLIKQYVNRDKDTIELRSYNPDYPPIYIPKAEVVNFFRVLQVHPRIWRP
jgi:phage repressor protein C with HTH and peptisase S24 domain